MTESAAESASKPAKELLALNPKQESEFKKKVQQAKKNKSSKVSRAATVETREKHHGYLLTQWSQSF